MDLVIVAEIQETLKTGLLKTLRFFSDDYRGAAREALLELAAMIRSRDDIEQIQRSLLEDFLYDAASLKSESMTRELLRALEQDEIMAWLKAEMTKSKS